MIVYCNLMYPSCLSRICFHYIIFRRCRSMVNIDGYILLVQWIHVQDFCFDYLQNVFRTKVCCSASRAKIDYVDGRPLYMFIFRRPPLCNHWPESSYSASHGRGLDSRGIESPTVRFSSFYTTRFTLGPDCSARSSGPETVESTFLIWCIFRRTCFLQVRLSFRVTCL